MATISSNRIEDYSEPPALAEPPDQIELTVPAPAGAVRLDRWLAHQLTGVSRTRIQRWIEVGAVEVDGALLAAGARLHGGERIVVTPLPREADQAFAPDPVPLAILHEDADLMVIDKPAGLVVHPAAGNWRGTLMNGLLHWRPDSARLPRAGIVHRLDKDTSGLMVVARNEPAMAALAAQLADRTAGRRYLALAEGRLVGDRAVDAPIGRDPQARVRMAVVPGGRSACTELHALRHGALAGVPVTLVLCRLQTGRTHQIRVHLRHIGHSLVGDELYGPARGSPLASGEARPAGAPAGAQAGQARSPLIERQALHAWRLTLRHPRDGAVRAWQSALPADLAAALTACAIDPDEAQRAARACVSRTGPARA